MNSGTFGLRLFRILNLCFLRTFLRYAHSLLLRIDLFLRFWFRLRVINFGLFGKIVQIEKLLACLCLSTENFPQCLLFFQLFGINFCFHKQLILLQFKTKIKNQHIHKERFNFSTKIEGIIIIFFEKQIKKKIIYQPTKNLMFATNNEQIPLHVIQNDLTQLQNQLLKFKIITNQVSFTSLLSQSDLNTKISSQLEFIQASINNFGKKYEQQIKNLQNRLNFFSKKSNEFVERNSWSQDQKYLLVTEKINMLQHSLKNTQKNQTKLIETINILIAKYHIQEQPTLIKNDEYLKSRIKTSEASSLISFQPCSGIFRQASLQKMENSRENLKKTMIKTEESIYLKNDHSNPCLNIKNNESLRYIRNFSKQGKNTKISLKQTPGVYQPIQFPNSNRKAQYNSIYSTNNSPGSLERHEHRFKFMMDNLYY